MAFFDAAGNRLKTTYLARMPEPFKATLTAGLEAELQAVVQERPDINICFASDGAAPQWAALEEMRARLPAWATGHQMTLVDASSPTVQVADEIFRKSNMKNMDLHQMNTDQERARKRPREVAGNLSLTDVNGWSDDAVAAIVCFLPVDNPVSTWASVQDRSLWRLARYVADPDRQPRDWASDLLRELACIASRFDEPLSADSTDLLADVFHLHHRHAQAHRLAWIDPFALTPAELKLLEKHASVDARVLTRLAVRLEALYHEGPSVTDADLERVQAKARRARSSPDERPLPAVLAGHIDTLLHGDDEAVRTMLERTTIEVLFHRYLRIPWLDDAQHRANLLRIVKLGFGWQRGVALKRLLSLQDTTEEDLCAAASAILKLEDLQLLLDRPALPPAALRTLWERFPLYQHLVVQHPRAPRDLLGARTDFVLSVAIKHTVDDGWLAETIERSRGTPLFLQVLDNPRCPPEVLVEVQSHDVVSNRASVAMHPRAPIETLRKLATDSAVEVRSGVTMNRATPAEVLDVLATDVDPDIRRVVASHPNLRLRTLESMLQDASAKVRKTAGSCLESARMAEGAVSVEVLVAASAKLRREVAWRTHMTDDVQAALAHDSDVRVRVQLALSNGVSVASLEALAVDDDPSVRHAVAQAARTPQSSLEHLARDRRRWVSQAAQESLLRIARHAGT